jgi:hypothetical protein
MEGELCAGERNLNEQWKRPETIFTSVLHWREQKTRKFQTGEVVRDLKALAGDVMEGKACDSERNLDRGCEQPETTFTSVLH